MSFRSLAWLTPALLALSATAQAQSPSSQPLFPVYARPVCDQLVQRIYSVADLVIPIEDFDCTLPIRNGQITLPSAVAAAPCCPPATCPAQACCPGPCPMPAPMAAQPMPTPVPCLVPAGAVEKVPGWPCPSGKTMEQRLIRLITSTVEPASWADQGGPATVGYYPVGMALVVQQSPKAHEQIAALLERMRHEQDVQVAVEVRIISLSDCGLERVGVDFNKVTVTKVDGGKRVVMRSEPDPDNILCRFAQPVTERVLFLDDGQVKQFLEAVQGDTRTNVMQAPKVTAFSGQRACINTTEQQFFVTSVKAVPANGQVVFVPQNEAVETGVKIALRPTVSADRQSVRVEVGVKLTDVDPQVPLMPVSIMIPVTGEHGEKLPAVPFTQFIQQPKVNTLSVDGTVCLNDGKTAMFYGGKRVREVRNEYGPPVLSKIPYVNRLFKNVGYGREEESLLVMVTPRIIVTEEKAEPRPTVVTASALTPAPVYVPTPTVGSEEQAVPPAPPADDKLAKLMEKYRAACNEGRTKAAKKLAERCLAIDPTCFGKDR
jgi:Flp pilus assembly secretin CpaC